MKNKYIYNFSRKQKGRKERELKNKQWKNFK